MQKPGDDLKLYRTKPIFFEKRDEMRVENATETERTGDDECVGTEQCGRLLGPFVVVYCGYLSADRPT